MRAASGDQRRGERMKVGSRSRHSLISARKRTRRADGRAQTIGEPHLVTVQREGFSEVGGNRRTRTGHKEVHGKGSQETGVRMYGRQSSAKRIHDSGIPKPEDRSRLQLA